MPDNVIVLKFGGTSVATQQGRASIVRRVEESISRAERPVIVVSAMGRMGAPYATDTLLSLVHGMPTDAREADLLMATGELVSAVVLAHELRAGGVAAAALTGPEAGIHTDGIHGGAAILEIDTTHLRELIDAGTVPVVAGFQGMGPDGAICTLGRGGSDTTACALGVALKATSVDIYTDVDGIMTADPRVCDDARVLRRISADELFQMARTGSKVVHTPAAELAFSSGAVVRVKNTFSDHEGTTVVDISSYRPDSVATAVSHVTGIARIRVTLPYCEDRDAHMGTQTSVYRTMADSGISIDMFTPLNDRLVFTVTMADLAKATEALSELGLEFATRSSLAKVTLVGAGMHGVPGVMARLSGCLASAGVDILQAADSHATISVLVREEDTRAAVDALHREFEL